MSELKTQTDDESTVEPGLEPDPAARRLTAAERQAYRDDGYVKNLPVFAPSAMAAIQRKFFELAGSLPDGVDINQTNSWNKASRWVHDLCRTPQILDYVEDIAGPDFYQWSAQFFVKYPHDGSVVPWHQDAQYWPLDPARTVTVWLAIFDADEGNGAMQIVRGSHRTGNRPHRTNDDPRYVLQQEIDTADFNPEDIVRLDLRAGQISLHDDSLIHGSPPNLSDRVRAGMTMRFAPTNVRCDLSVWPNFEVIMARGVDRHGLNPVAPVPLGECTPIRKFQHSSEFTQGRGRP